MANDNPLSSLAILEEENKKLWQLIEQTLEFYNSLACPCAFPRFHQYAAIDCVDFRGSFYMSETEAFLHHCKPYFDVQEIEAGSEAYRALYTCKKCRSTYEYAWSDFSIRISRTYLKIQQMQSEQIGAPAKNPIPFYIGLFGHKLPGQDQFKRTELADLMLYLLEVRKT